MYGYDLKYVFKFIVGCVNITSGWLYPAHYNSNGVAIKYIHHVKLLINQEYNIAFVI